MIGKPTARQGGRGGRARQVQIVKVEGGHDRPTIPMDNAIDPLQQG